MFADIVSANSNTAQILCIIAAALFAVAVVSRVRPFVEYWVPLASGLCVLAIAVMFLT